MMVKTLLCSIVFLLFGPNLIFAQERPTANGAKELATKYLNNVRIKAQGVETLFIDLSLSYDIPIGLEIASHDDEFATYEVNLKAGTLTDLLNQFTDMHRQYSWNINNGVVNVFPKNNFRDFVITDLLNVQISNFSVKANSSCWAFVESLLNTAEVQNALKMYGMNRSKLNFGGGYFPQLGRQFSFDVSNRTVRQILNQVISQSQIAKIWLVKKYSTDQTLLIRVNARHEDL
jgi:hypothetical protein